MVVLKQKPLTRKKKKKMFSIVAMILLRSDSNLKDSKKHSNLVRESAPC